MHAWEAIQKTLNYIEDNISENLTIETLSTTAALSPYYYQRLFKRLVKISVFEYIKLRKLANAAEALLKRESRILDIAIEYGFSDHANFTRAFKETYDLTPEEYRNNPVILNHFMKPDLLLNYVEVDVAVPLITDGIVVEVTYRNLSEPIVFIGISGEVPATELSGGSITGIATTGLLWTEFHKRKLTIPYLLPNGKEFGVFHTGNAREGCCTYMVGAEATGPEAESLATIEDLSSYLLQAASYVVCRVEAASFNVLIGSAIFKASFFMKNWMNKHDHVCNSIPVELYYQKNNEAYFMELWLPLLSPATKQIIKQTWNLTQDTKKPSLESIHDYVNSPYWEQLCRHLETDYQSKPVLEYSKCSMQYGWNVKYKKAGRTLCTLYPMENYFIALVVIGEREKVETEFVLPLFTEYLQQLYQETKAGMGQKWLMIHVTNDDILRDVKQCIAIRRGSKKKITGG